MHPSSPFYQPLAASPVIHPSTVRSSTSSSISTSPSSSSAILTEPTHYHQAMNQSSLLSPPGALPQENFTMASPENQFPAKIKSTLAVQRRLPISPPISPATKADDAHDPLSSVRDPILYPHTETQTPQRPLFSSSEDVAQSMVKKHVAAREPDLFGKVSPPRHSDYELALDFTVSFKSHIMEAVNSNREKWRKRELGYLLADRELHRSRYAPIAPARSRPKATAHTRKPSGVVKPKIVRASPNPDRPKNVAREDKDFDALRDFCPPIDSLPSKPNCLKVDWKGTPIDLSNDPHRHLLHKEERALAAGLRLDCATYLTSKRRIFQARVEALRLPKEFRKTDAQQACKIDVNKASKMWTAFDRVGWLKPEWVRQFA